ncbi:hypothetical protein BSIN_2521 [Burkholderia singularis]|uniref:Uncharacterized protein n=1 Tax=Burkholderia singularis TaxID=1503053 RepID=A0A238H398_9BURK|nr:hypothetical protein BSIN_2521 [Burkholderia singularis]
MRFRALEKITCKADEYRDCQGNLFRMGALGAIPFELIPDRCFYPHSGDFCKN